MTDDLAPGARLTTSSAISLGLVLVLIAGAISYGRQAQRLDSIEQDVAEMRAAQAETQRDIRAVRDILLRGDFHTLPPR